ncbi:MAG TPA: rod shape-determining protein MreC [Candidatus Levybacteria bacterium]|nr:rod shape-determining protein MreC [Candidatus Levybacteria bacterium]
MRKKLLIALAVFFLLSVGILLTKDSSPSLFIQGLAQSVYKNPKAALYSFSATANNTNQAEQLRQENIKLREKLVEFEHLQKDNDALKSQFEEEAIPSDELLPAQIIGFQGGIARPDVLIIDKGNRDDISKGQAVVVGKNLVGVIHAVGDRYSSVLLTTNPLFSTVAKVSSGDALGVIQGAGNFLLFDRVAITDELQKGDTVVTRGTVDAQTGGIPPDLVLGVIESVRKVESEPFQGAQVKSLVDSARLTRVFIWK